MLKTATVAALLGLAFIPAAHAAQDCAGGAIGQPLALPPTVLSPLAAELQAPGTQLGAPSGVLAQGYDDALSLDRVLLRMKLDGCRSLSRATPAGAGVANPNDPAAYKPQTAFDNTPWRFDMTQNGKRMTAEEFDAWMKARGVRVAKGAGAAAAPAAPAVAPAATDAPKQ